MLSVESIFYNPKDQSEKELRKKRKKFINSDSDHMTLLNIFNIFKDLQVNNSKKEAIEFAKSHFINEKSLQKAMLINDQLNEYLNDILKRRKNENN